MNGSPFFLRGSQLPARAAPRPAHLRAAAGRPRPGPGDQPRRAPGPRPRPAGGVLPARRPGRHARLRRLPADRRLRLPRDPEEGRFFEASVREQVPELVELLRNRPSIALWTAHDDPPWIAANASLADVHSVRQNYSIDQEARGLFEKLDPSRPALAGSGDLDSQVGAGLGSGGLAGDRRARAAPRLRVRCPGAAHGGLAGLGRPRPRLAGRRRRPGLALRRLPALRLDRERRRPAPPTTSRWPPTSRPARPTRPGSSATRPTSSGCASSSPAGEPSPTSSSIPSRRSGSGSSTTPAIPRLPSPRSGRRWPRPG